MKEITKYIACDGKEFESKELCCSYEAELYGMVQILYSYIEDTGAYDKTMYVILETDKAKELEYEEIQRICYYIAERELGRRLTLRCGVDEPYCDINVIADDLINRRDSIITNWVISCEIKYITQKEFEEQINDKYRIIII